MNKIFAIICISMLTASAAFCADEPVAIAVKNKSSFKHDAGTRSPFWPISWKPTGKVASGGTDQGEVPAGAFVVSTITLDGAARFAIINGTTVPMARYILSITFNPNANAKPAATPAAGRRKPKKDE